MSKSAMVREKVELRDDNLPFDMVVPNTTTKRTIKNTDAKHELIVCKDADDMFDKLGI